MRLAADSLSQSLLTGMSICERERAANDRGQGGRNRGRQMGRGGKEGMRFHGRDEGLGAD